MPPSTVSPDQIRSQFAAAMSVMYRTEVPLYDSLFSLVESINNQEINRHPDAFKKTNKTSYANNELLNCERHGAIRLGTADELFNMRRLFSTMGMYPVDYYDLSVAGIPVHSTAFRPIDLHSLNHNPFRIFTSLLRLDLIDDEKLRKIATTQLSQRKLFSDDLHKLIETSEKQGGLTSKQAQHFITEALEVFRWHQQAPITKQNYDLLNTNHRLIADIVSFKGPHINHLTPRSLNIDAVQEEMLKQGFKTKSNIEGPPYRQCPILLRQTSFIALQEDVTFSDAKEGTHTARFGEIEQRGIALTPKGRAMYDAFLNKARNNDSSDINYSQKLQAAFLRFPDNHREMHAQSLAYYQYIATSKASNRAQSSNIEQLIDDGFIEIKPIIYEDFLPVSAAGIFKSNLSNTHKPAIQQDSKQTAFEEALGTPVIDSLSLYQKIQDDSLAIALKVPGI